MDVSDTEFFYRVEVVLLSMWTSGVVDSLPRFSVCSKAPPTFVTTPTNIEVSVSDRRVLFKCLATGQPTPTITWRKDGERLRENRRHIISSEGTLTIIDPRFDDQGNYECVAQNTAGEIVSKAELNYYGVEGDYQFNYLLEQFSVECPKQFRDCFGFAVLRFVIGLKIPRHFRALFC